MADLTGQTAVVVGASRTAPELDAVAAEITRAGGQARGVTADASQERDTEQIMAAALTVGGTLDLLLVCVGAALIKPLPDVTLSEWEHIFAMNTRSVFLINRAALRLMLPAGRGLILNIASRAGITGAPNVAAYTAAKAAVIGFSRALAQEVKGRGVRVACLAPAPMDTPMRCAATPDFDPTRLLSTDAVVDLILYLAHHPEVTPEDPVVPISIRL